MTTELETNIVAVERVKEYTETPTEVNSSYFIYIPTQGVVSENDNRVRDKHCSCRESEGIHRNSYYRSSQRMTTELETNIVAVERVKEYTETPTEETTELETNIVAVERVKEYTETPTEVNSSYFIYIPTQGVVSENDNRVRDKHCSCRESEGIHRNSYRGVVSENDNRVRDNIVAVESEGMKEYTET
ncbi:unnamed protein product [Mytilus edulis]|uniref:Uncharacterized protein n=1 Tax=Mytilus edulis TaxID=6550 RepID=A0A8S3T8Y9_MYTED|nr:unnamed protein product [Mytilus edulis]